LQFLRRNVMQHGERNCARELRLSKRHPRRITFDDLDVAPLGANSANWPMPHQSPVPLVETPRFATGPWLSRGQGQFPKHSVPGRYRRSPTEVSVRRCCASAQNGRAIDVSGSCSLQIVKNCSQFTGCQLCALSIR
jgi:hypothetical protein